MDNENTKSYLQQWEAIVDATDQKKALIEHFSYLADSPNYEKLLVQIMEELDEVSIVDDSLVISFEMFIELTASKPATEIPEHFPATFKDKLKKHASLDISESQVILGDLGLFCETDGWFKEMNEWRDICDLNKVISPLLTQESNLWLYHPTEKNPSGEPKLYFKAHDGGDVEDPRNINIGALFLEQLASLLEIDVLDIISPTNDNELKTWWDRLDAAWKKYLLPESTQKAPTPSNIKKLLKEKNQVYLEGKTGITNLEPLKKFKNIDSLVLEGLQINDFSPIRETTLLRTLAIENMAFSDFDIFEDLQRLNYIRFKNAEFSNLKNLQTLKKLHSLVLNQNPLKTLDGIENFPELVRLEINDTLITSISHIKDLKRLEYLEMRNLSITDYPVFAKMDKLPMINGYRMSNAVLTFNIACFYALKGEKTQMLETIKQALKLGKVKKEFVDDNDFSAYYNDPDFIKVLTDEENR